MCQYFLIILTQASSLLLLPALCVNVYVYYCCGLKFLKQPTLASQLRHYSVSYYLL